MCFQTPVLLKWGAGGIALSSQRDKGLCMGLKGDIEEVKTVWSKSAWWVRCWLALSAYLAVSSIASLAETVVKWKGFFQDAINFNKTWINSPLRNILRICLNLNLPEMVTNFIVVQIIIFSIYFIVITSEMEGFITELKIYKDSKNNDNSYYKKMARHLMLLEIGNIINTSLFIAYVAMLLKTYNNSTDISVNDVLWQVIVILLIPIISIFMQNRKYRDLTVRLYVNKFYAPIILIVIIVGLLAAVNKGF